MITINSIPIKDDTLRSLISCINKNPTGGNFASGAAWHTNVFKVPGFHLFRQILTTLYKIPIIIKFEEVWYSENVQYKITVGVVYSVHSNYENERPVVCFKLDKLIFSYRIDVLTNITIRSGVLYL